MLTFNLKKEWFEKIARGEKRVEYREVKSFWNERITNALANVNGVMLCGKNIVYEISPFTCSILPCVFVLGYTNKKLPATISKIEIVDGKNTDLHIDKPVYAIHFELVKEVKK